MYMLRTCYVSRVDLLGLGVKNWNCIVYTMMKHIFPMIRLGSILPLFPLFVLHTGETAVSFWMNFNTVIVLEVKKVTCHTSSATQERFQSPCRYWTFVCPPHHRSVGEKLCLCCFRSLILLFFSRVWRIRSSSQATARAPQPRTWARRNIITQNHERKKFFDFRFNVNSVSRSVSFFILPRILILSIPSSSTIGFFVTFSLSLSSCWCRATAQTAQHSLFFSYHRLLCLLLCVGRSPPVNGIDVAFAPKTLKKIRPQPYKFSSNFDDDCDSIVLWVQAHTQLDKRALLFSDDEHNSRHLRSCRAIFLSFCFQFYCVCVELKLTPVRPPRSSWQHNSPFGRVVLSSNVNFHSNEICEISKQLKRISLPRGGEKFRDINFFQLRLRATVRDLRFVYDLHCSRTWGREKNYSWKHIIVCKDGKKTQ